MSDREIEIKDILIRDELISFLKKKNVDVTAIYPLNCTLENLVITVLDKNLEIKSGEKFIHELSLEGIIFPHKSKLVDVKNKIQERFILTFIILDPLKKSEDYKQLIIHVADRKFKNISGLMQIRELKITRIKNNIYKSILSLREIIYGEDSNTRNVVQ